MKGRIAAVCVGVVLSAVPLVADDLSVVVAPRVDFTALRSFAMQQGKVESARPELDNPLFVKRLRNTIRAALTERGLTETTGTADLLVDFLLTGEDFSVGVPTAARGIGPQPVRFTEGTLVIDLSRPGDPAPIWRGVYRDDERTGSKLVQKLPADAKQLVAKYPRLK